MISALDESGEILSNCKKTGAKCIVHCNAGVSYLELCIVILHYCDFSYNCRLYIIIALFDSTL